MINLIQLISKHCRGPLSHFSRRMWPNVTVEIRVMWLDFLSCLEQERQNILHIPSFLSCLDHQSSMNEQRHRWILGPYAELDDKRVWVLIVYTALNGCLHWDCQKHQPQRHPVSSPQRWGPRLFAGSTQAFPCAVWRGLYVGLHNRVQ